MKKIIGTLTVLIACAGLAFGQSPAMVRFIEQLENLNDRMAVTIASGDNAEIESLYMEVVSIYDKQPRDVKDSAAPLIKGVWYNIACARALQGNSSGALDALDTAIEYGWDDYTHTMNDTDLTSLHGNERFTQLTEKIRK